MSWRDSVDGAKNVGASTFNAGEDIQALIKSGTQQAMTKQGNGIISVFLTLVDK